MLREHESFKSQPCHPPPLVWSTSTSHRQHPVTQTVCHGLRGNTNPPIKSQEVATMNTRPVIESSNNTVALSVSFNSDASCFSVGLENGFCSMWSWVSTLIVPYSNSVPVFNSEPCQKQVHRGAISRFSTRAMLSVEQSSGME